MDEITLCNVKSVIRSDEPTENYRLTLQLHSGQQRFIMCGFTARNFTVGSLLLHSLTLFLDS